MVNFVVEITAVCESYSSEHLLVLLIGDEDMTHQNTPHVL